MTDIAHVPDAATEHEATCSNVLPFHVACTRTVRAGGRWLHEELVRS